MSTFSSQYRLIKHDLPEAAGPMLIILILTTFRLGGLGAVMDERSIQTQAAQRSGLDLLPDDKRREG
jgi:hypothetical protein